MYGKMNVSFLFSKENDFQIISMYFFKNLILREHISVSFMFGQIVTLSIFDLYWKLRACPSYSGECSGLFFLSFKSLCLMRLDMMCTW